ncbi:copper resistance CopC family protein [Nonomuraea guangzhouensis]|uniref:Copper resistance protein CopC n=1 Tax=Nonomuraea guangzhouensis TaxID=1291555 RepID=A0ABW4G2J6_9ACTN|nr:copper resistance protein CopC [Nonomuraea guangzhouensis]
MSTFLRRTLVAVIGCGLFLAVTAPAALAHDSLKSSSPAKGATVSSVETIELEYSSRIRFPLVVLRTAAGQMIKLGEPQADGPKVRTAVPGPLAGGSYVIAWRVVSSDGHPIEGEIPFTVKGTSSGTTAPATAAAATTAPAAAAQTSRPAAAAQGGGGIPGWLWAGLAALVVLGLAIWLLSRRTGGPGEPAGQPDAPVEQPGAPTAP